MFSIIHHEKYTTVLQDDRKIFDILYSFSVNIEHKLNAQNIAETMVAAMNAEEINAEMEREAFSKMHTEAATGRFFGTKRSE